MKVLPIILCCAAYNLPQEVTGGIVKTMFKTFFDRGPTTTTTIATTLPTEIVPVEEIIFRTASKLQVLFGPTDNQARLNYVISPISIVSVLGELLIGTQGTYHEYFANFLGLSYTNPANTTQHDDKLYHSDFHSSLQVRQQINNHNEDYNASFQDALIYNQNFEPVEHFKRYITEFYGTDLLNIDFKNPGDRLNTILKWTDFINTTKTNQLLNIDNVIAKSLLFDRFEFHSTWETPLNERIKKETFSVTPYHHVNIKYLSGTIRNTVYVDNDQFTLAVIPLKSGINKMYVMLPKGEIPIRRFSERLRDFSILRNTEQDYPDRQDVKIKIPNIFTQIAEMDLMKPFMNDLTAWGTPLSTYIDLNGASNDLKLTNLLSQISWSVRNEEVEKNPANLGLEIIEDKEAKHFTVVKPFLFFIMHETSKVVLIWGSISDPSKFDV